jgi:CheY-like chemotaxis protein
MSAEASHGAGRDILRCDIAARPLRVVICDDADDVRELFAELLRVRGHHVTTVADGHTALHAIVEEQPDVAVIDIGLPGMNGYDLARAVRQRLSTTRLRLVAVTGFGRAQDRIAAFDAGFDAHVTKPATIDAIVDAMSNRDAARTP